MKNNQNSNNNIKTQQKLLWLNPEDNTETVEVCLLVSVSRSTTGMNVFKDECGVHMWPCPQWGLDKDQDQDIMFIDSAFKT